LNYLLKTEPSTYSFADLQREGTAIWDGVNNPVARKSLAGMKKGDKLVIYHTGDEKAVVGAATVVVREARRLKAYGSLPTLGERAPPQPHIH